MKSCRRIHLPDRAGDEKEAQLQRIRDIVGRETDKYTKINCDKKGKILETKVLSVEQELGQNELKTHLKENKFVCGTTDKSGKYFVTTNEAFEKEVEIHCGDDKDITYDAVKEL